MKHIQHVVNANHKPYKVPSNILSRFHRPIQDFSIQQKASTGSLLLAGGIGILSIMFIVPRIRFNIPL